MFPVEPVCVETGYICDGKDEFSIKHPKMPDKTEKRFVTRNPSLFSGISSHALIFLRAYEVALHFETVV
jgi:hypothetical protein